ncbi:MAG: hypothetical protein GC181_02760 [Bacteroidetes bacterium]|nr:hypothetical protein [Bacteroidota bacterium]
MKENRQVSRIEVMSLLIISLLAIAALWYLAWLSPGVEGGMDSYNHYLISRFSWQHPGELMLDQWGKPLYNILASPFAQFGMMGVEVFNILLLVSTAWITWFTARKLGFKLAWFGFILALASPVFFDNTISGLTEPLNAFLLMLSIYLLVSDRLLAGALVAGFLPYARSEGFVIMAVIGFYLLFVRKSPRAFFMLLAGSVIMNFIGWIVEGEPFWIYSKNPYIKYQRESMVDQKNICGSGALLHYWHALRWIMGMPRKTLFVLGSIVTLFVASRGIPNIIRKKANSISLIVILIFGLTALVTGIKFLEFTAITGLLIWLLRLYVVVRNDDRTDKLFWLLFGIYFLYFSIHSLIWYYGLMGSCGYERVMVVIDPLAAILMLLPLEITWRYLSQLLPKHLFRFIPVLLIILSGVLMYWPWKIYGHKYPIDISDEQKLFVEAANWYNESSYQNRMKYFLYPYLNMLTGIDPKDHEHFTEIWSFDIQYAPKGSIVIWDGHFGPNEGKVPLELLMNHPDFVKIKSFYPAHPFKTLNDYNFEIHVFERVKGP